MTSRESNPGDYARGVLEVEAETLRRERDTALRMLSRVVDAFEDYSHDLDARMGEARRLLDRAAS